MTATREELAVREAAVKKETLAILKARKELSRQEESEKRKKAHDEFVVAVETLGYDWHSDAERSNWVLGINKVDKYGRTELVITEWAEYQAGVSLTVEEIHSLRNWLNANFAD